MEVLIQLRLDDGGCIKKQVLVGGPSPPTEPRYKHGEINVFVNGDDAFSYEVLLFLIEKLKEGTIIQRELAKDTNIPK